MKKIFLGVIAALSLTSCVGDLDQMPMASNVVTDVYSNPIYRKGQLAKIYGGFVLVGQNGPGASDIAVADAGASEFLRAWWSIQEVSTDECKCNWGDPWVTEVNQNSWSSTKNDAIYATYTRAMMMISFANEYLRNTNDDDPEIATERSEVRFLRSYAYWILLDCFGNPPFVTETDPVGAFKPRQTNAKELFGWIKQELVDLTSESSHLKAPHTQVYPRVDKGAAYGLLSRLCLNHKAYLGEEQPELYREAADAARKVIENYDLAKNYTELFMGDNGENPECLKEFIFSSCYDAQHTQSFGGTTFLICASQDNIDGKYTLGVGGNWNGLVTTTECVANLIGQGEADKAKAKDETDFTAIDRRALVTLKYSSDKKVSGDNFEKGWHMIKFNNNRASDPDVDYAEKENLSSVDFPMMRAGEMFLNYAEAMARVSGGTTSDALAVECVNRLRMRAGIEANLTKLTLDNLFTEISRELFWEGLRRTTLIRFDRYSSGDYLWPLKGGVKDGQAFAKHLELFPLPSDDLQINDNLKQNPGY